MKKVMTYAYTSFNLGDDLFLKILFERYPHTKFVLFANHEYKEIFKSLTNVEVISNNSLLMRGSNFIFRTLKKPVLIQRWIAKKCDLAVYIGGSLFIQSENWELSLRKNKDLLIKRQPFFLLGANFGPFQDETFYLEHKELFKHYEDVCFREKHSYTMFSDLENVRQADDIVFQLKRSSVGLSGNKIVISVIKPSVKENLKSYENIYYEKMSEISKHFIDQGYRVTLMSFCKYEGDMEAINKIIEKVPADYQKSIDQYVYEKNIDEALSVIADSTFVVASRFHAMILGWVYNKPIFPIVYSTKMTNVMKDVGYSGGYSEFDQLINLKPEVVFENMSQELLRIEERQKTSAKHFKILDETLS
ncbi:polysaccharide pyruvyl transferase family protein [Domibacillus iocasae]|uniref:Polysaccharide pyruvyl transferase domain-containing protein n=1 Tax=Domibacillus iocasae TaxID=1714016 RepID=A0A1E7DPH1_9BACI|nr:polysaccharide pyruvyl transferase family protein [Domibacillus iocasae]OES44954.1 hypothetical protein BA724_06740 [Domibacillus iocasae]